MKAAIYPGSFDPMTLGHLDVIRRASQMFDTLIVSVLDNKSKNALFSVEERVSILKEATKDLPNVEVDSFNGLLIDYAKQKCHYLEKRDDIWRRLADNLVSVDLTEYLLRNFD